MCFLYTKNDGGKPYLRMLSAKMRTAQKCIQELNTCKDNHKTEVREKLVNEREFYPQIMTEWGNKRGIQEAFSEIYQVTNNQR